MVRNLAGISRKAEIFLEMCSLSPKDTSKYLECHYSMFKFDFIEISTSFSPILHVFGNFAENHQKS